MRDAVSALNCWGVGVSALANGAASDIGNADTGPLGGLVVDVAVEEASDAPTVQNVRQIPHSRHITSRRTASLIVRPQVRETPDLPSGPN